MSPFDPNYKPQAPDPTPYERAAASNARKTSQRLQALLDANGPTRAPSASERRAADDRNARIRLRDI